MSNTITRRTALAVPVTLPLLPLTAYAGATTTNATDAAWAAYEVAKARHDESKRLYDAYEAALPIGPMPCFFEFEDRDEWERLRKPWDQARAQYPANPYDLEDDALAALVDPITEAENDILSAKSATLTDVERKLAVISGWDGYHVIEPEAVDSLLSDVRSLRGVA